MNDTLRSNLSLFIQQTFATVDPLTEYLHNWHIDLIAEYLNACKAGQIKRLIINIPPRCLKSISVSVAFPAFLLGHNPSTKIIVASYGYKLVKKLTNQTRLTMESDWYRRLFPATQFSRVENTQELITTTRHGFRNATSVGGAITGEGGDYIIADDLHNVLDAQSETKRQTALDWYDQTLSPRVNNKKKAVKIVIMQRMHESDLTGHLQEKGGYELVCLPATAEKKTIICFGIVEQTRQEGDLLHPERDGENELKQERIALGEYAYAGQYQQRPAPLGGGMIKIDWFKRFNIQPDDKAVTMVIQSWDTAMKDNTGSDYSVCTTWLQTAKGHYWIDTYRAKLEFPELKRMCKSLASKYKPHAILIEDKGSGTSLIQEFRGDRTMNILKINPERDKVTRMSFASPVIEAGNAYIPESAPWLPDATNEMMQFPNGSHDDIVDSMSQYLNWQRLKQEANPQIRML